MEWEKIISLTNQFVVEDNLKIVSFDNTEELIKIRFFI